MGRIEAPINGSGTLARFAADLRELRREAGNPPYRQLAKTAHYSAATLSQAASGQAWPTLPVTLAYVHACGGDETAWQQRWEHDRHPSAVSDEGAPAVGASPAFDRRRRWPTVAVIGGMVAATATVALSVPALTAVASGSSARPGPAAPAPVSERVRDGQDPYIAGCGKDERELERRDIAWPDGTHYGQLVLFYSAACQAAWGYVYGPNSPDWEVYIAATRPRDGHTAPSSWRGTARPNSWGNLLSAHHACVAAQAHIVRAGRTGPTALTSCFQDSGPVTS